MLGQQAEEGHHDGGGEVDAGEELREEKVARGSDGGLQAGGDQGPEGELGSVAEDSVEEGPGNLEAAEALKRRREQEGEDGLAELVLQRRVAVLVGVSSSTTGYVTRIVYIFLRRFSPCCTSSSEKSCRRGPSTGVAEGG